MSLEPQSKGHRPQILVLDPIAPIGLEMLQAQFDVDLDFKLSAEALLDRIGEYDGIIVRDMGRISPTVMAAGMQLKIIGRPGPGFKNLDVVAAQAHNLAIVNCPDANTLAVAEHTLALMLALARRMPKATLSLKAGQWDRQHLLGTGLAGKTLGIVGFGRIGREVAIRAHAFGMRVLVNQKRETPETKLEHVQSVDLSILLKEADFVTLHVPLNEGNRHLIGRAELGQMKPTAYLVNTARGGVVDDVALLAALEAGQIAGAGLDVFEGDPQENLALIHHERVIATPHIGASTKDAQEATAVSLAEQFIEFFEDVDVQSILPLAIVPLEKVVPHEFVDQKRVDRLKARIESSGRLMNPPIVMETKDCRFMVLDGATRTAAMKQLDFPHAVVQLASPEAGLGLGTWFHIVQKLPGETLLQMIADLPEIDSEPVEPDEAAQALFEYGGLCTVHLADERVFLVHAKPGVNRMDALNKLVAAYINAGHVERTLEQDVIKLREQYPELGALIVFPEYTVQQVIQFSLLNGRYFPAGITRFIIPGRILRLNADLDVLKSDQSLRDKNRWLYKTLLEKQQKSGIRYYAEPVYLLDE